MKVITVAGALALRDRRRRRRHGGRASARRGARSCCDWNVTTPAGGARPRASAHAGHGARRDVRRRERDRIRGTRRTCRFRRVTRRADARAAAAAAAYGVLRAPLPRRSSPLSTWRSRRRWRPSPTARRRPRASPSATRRRRPWSRAAPATTSCSRTPSTSPGRVPPRTSSRRPRFANPVNQIARDLRALRDGAQRPVPPERAAATLDSRRFLDDYDEVRTPGRGLPEPDDCARTPEQTMIARWHAEQAFPQFSRIARILTAARARADLLDTARTFALLGLAMADGFVSVFEAKYTYHFVRPVTAIRARRRGRRARDDRRSRPGRPCSHAAASRNTRPATPSSRPRAAQIDQEGLRQPRGLRHHRAGGPGRHAALRGRRRLCRRRAGGAHLRRHPLPHRGGRRAASRAEGRRSCVLETALLPLD